MSFYKKVIMNGQTPHIFMRKVLNRLPLGWVRNLLIPFPHKRRILETLQELGTKMDGEKVFLFPSPSCPWGYMFQRPQQLARALAATGHTVIYGVDTSFPYEPDWYVRGLHQLDENLFLYNDNEGGRLLQALTEMGKLIVVWQYWPHQSSFVSELEKQGKLFRIYDCIDHLNTFLAYPEIQSDFKKSISEADLVLATASSIYQDLLQYREDILSVPNGVCVDDFVSFTKRSWETLDVLREKRDVVIGYYGAIAEWFDFDLVQYLAESKPNWTFLIVGEAYPSVEKKIRHLQKCPNVVILNRVPYSDIPQLLSYFDVGLLPFLINDITLSTSPVKVFEYMAGGKITVSSDLPEIRNLHAVKIAESPEEFVRKLQEALQNAKDSNNKVTLLNAVQQHSWEGRTKKVLAELEKRLNKNE